jgi:hypothetical protein
VNNSLANAHWTSTVVVVANLAGATVAAVVGWVAAHKAPRFRRGSALLALLATVYVAAYGWLLWSDVHPADWSQAVRWVGLASWPIVWVWPMLRLIRRTAEAERAAVEIEEALLRGLD